MKVTHVHRIGGVGGSERHLLTLLPALANRDIEVSFVGLDDVGNAPEPFYERLEAASIPFVRLPCAHDLDPALARRLVTALRQRAPDIVHTHLVHADVYGAIGAGRAKAALVSTKHNDDPFRSGNYRHVERLLTRRAARVICITEALRVFNIEQVGLPPEKLEVVHYGMDELPHAWGPADLASLPDGARVVLGILRLVPQKGVDVALEALARLRPHHPDLHLVVLGEGPERGRLERRAVELGVNEAVSFPGRAGDVAEWLRRSELLVHPARWEGFGIALLEAMLAGLPVVASEVSSIPEVVIDGATGLLVRPDDAVALATAIESLLANPTRARELGEAGRARVLDSFSVGRMAERTIAVYESVSGVMVDATGVVG